MCDDPFVDLNEAKLDNMGTCLDTKTTRKP